MTRTRRPCRVHEGIMKVLLDVINDLGDIHCRNVGVQSTTCGRFDDGFVMARADGGLDVRVEQFNDAGLIVGGHSALRFSALALHCARLAGRHALFHDQMIAAEQAATEGTRAPSGRGRFAATCRALEFEWNGEHLSPLLRNRRQNPADSPWQDIRGMRELRSGMPLRRRPGELQIQRVARPRNQLYLDHEVAGIWRPHPVSGRAQHPRQMALQCDLQALAMGLEHDRLEERSMASAAAVRLSSLSSARQRLPTFSR